MKHIFLVVFICLIFIACGEDNEEQNDFLGKVSYNKNDKFIETQCVISFINYYGFEVLVYNTADELREKLVVDSISEIEKGILKSDITAFYNTRVSHGDVIQSHYYLDTTANNYFIIDTYNETTGDVSGRFQLTMILEVWYDLYNEPESDTLRFTEGQFETRINYLK